ILGTERHESRRIDNQLRGRSGRQGDPGESRFYLSGEDDLVRLFAGGRLYRILDRLGPVSEDGVEEPIEAGMLSKQIENAQKKVEEQNFLIRKRVLEYDDVMNQQREVIYEYRDRVLEGEDLSDEAREHVREVIERLVSEYTPGDFVEDWDVAGLFAQIEQLFPTEIDPSELSPERGLPRRSRPVPARAPPRRPPGACPTPAAGRWAAPRPSPWPRPRPAPPRRLSRTARHPSRRCRCFPSRWSSATSTSTSRSAGTIPAGADRARNSRSATGRSRSEWPPRPPRSRRRSAWRR